MAYNQKIIKCNLSVESINKAIKQLNAYKKRLEDCNKRMVKELVQRGYDVADVIVSIVPLDEINYDAPEVRKTKMTVSNGKVSASITMTGEQSLAVEFGTGVTFNTPIGDSKNPHGKELGWTIGSGSYGEWAGKEHADDPDGWWYMDRHGNLQHTFGHKAWMPMTVAERTIISDVYDVAQQVYGRL